jgi:hypothetical protein
LDQEIAELQEEQQKLGHEQQNLGEEQRRSSEEQRRIKQQQERTKEAWSGQVEDWNTEIANLQSILEEEIETVSNEVNNLYPLKRLASVVGAGDDAIRQAFDVYSFMFGFGIDITGKAVGAAFKKQSLPLDNHNNVFENRGRDV